MFFCRYSSVDNSSALRIQERAMDFSWNCSYVLTGENTTVFTYYSQFREKNHFVDGLEVTALLGIFLLSVAANASIIFCVIRLVLLSYKSPLPCALCKSSFTWKIQRCVYIMFKAHAGKVAKAKHQYL